MYSFRIILWLCVASAHFTSKIALAESCVNPDEVVCKKIWQSMSHIVRKPVKTKEDIKFMKDAICGFAEEDPKVCCSNKVPIITNECSTPDGVKGQCIDVNNCTFITYLKNIMNLQIRLLKFLTCKKQVYRDLGDGQICAGGEVGKDSCKGDSGGPLIYLQPGGRYEVIGIISGGIGACAGAMPALYTHVFKYLHWIRNTIRNALASR